MPTYTNNTSNSVQVPSKIDGVPRLLKPGDSIESFAEVAGITKDLQTPVFNPILVLTNDIAGTSDSLTLNASTDKVMIYSDPFNPVINMMRGVADNTPGEPLLPGKTIWLDVKRFSVGGALYFTSTTAIVAGKLIIAEYQDAPY